MAGGQRLDMENLVLTAPLRHSDSKAEGHCHLWHGPQPTEPLRRRCPRRCLQLMATFQRTGSLRRSALYRRLLHHELGY